MFAVLFGLSMDYQVFLISQIEQHRADASSDREAIAAGLASGARVIIAAALIMIVGVRELHPQRRPDRQAVRRRTLGRGRPGGDHSALLAPAFLVLVGRGARWVPHWADRRLPHIDIEGAGAGQAKEAAEPGT